MKITKEYKLSAYQDYGPLDGKENIRLVRNKNTGWIGVRKNLMQAQKEIVDFRTRTCAPYFPEVLERIEEGMETILIEEYIEGVTLEAYMMGSPLPEEQAVKFARQICEALKCLHNYQPMIIYRDLKPENIMISAKEEVKLIDFDISRKYQEGKKYDTELLGTAAYAAPEQFGYFQTDNRTDIYAFGIVFNYMLTGKTTKEYVTESKYAPIVQKCIEFDPAGRYQRIEEVLAELSGEKYLPEMTDEKQKEETEKNSWVIPGFRSGTPWKMVLGGLGYLFMISTGLIMEFTDSDGIPYPAVKQWVNRIMLILSQLVTVLFVFNYRGISRKIQFYRHPSWIVRILSFAATALVFMVIAVIFTVILETIFHL